MTEKMSGIFTYTRNRSCFELAVNPISKQKTVITRKPDDNRPIDYE
jgi:hypothetical protein